MTKKKKKIAFISMFLSVILTAGTIFTLNTANLGASLSDATDATDATDVQTETVVEDLDGARINPLYVEDNIVEGVFNSRHMDVYVYLYVNEDFKTYERVEEGNQFSITLDEYLSEGDIVRADIAAYNSNKIFSSPEAVVTVRPEGLASPKVEYYVGPFELGGPVLAGNQEISGEIPLGYENAFIYVYVNGKYYGGRQFLTGNNFDVDLKNPLLSGDNLTIKLYSYKIRDILKGEMVVE